MDQTEYDRAIAAMVEEQNSEDFRQSLIVLGRASDLYRAAPTEDNMIVSIHAARAVAKATNQICIDGGDLRARFAELSETGFNLWKSAWNVIQALIHADEATKAAALELFGKALENGGQTSVPRPSKIEVRQ